MFVLFGGFLLHITANRAFRFVVWVFAHKFRVFLTSCNFSICHFLQFLLAIP